MLGDFKDFFIISIINDFFTGVKLFIMNGIDIAKKNT